MRERTTMGTQRHHFSRRLAAAFAAAVLFHLAGTPLPAEARTATPTVGPTPQRTGDLGERDVSGRVVDASDSSGIPGATVRYHHIRRFSPADSGSVETGAAGDFAFRLFLHDSDHVVVSAEAVGYAPDERSFIGYQLWTGPPLELALSRLSGVVEITPNRAQTLPCEAAVSVSIANSSTAGEPLTITEIWLTNSYSQGDYGTGFSSDLSGIDVPLTLQPGEHIEIPVHYSAADQQFPSRLTVRLESTAGPGFAVPYRGEIAGCGASPTPTATPLHTTACAGDCDGDGRVTIAELVRGVALALGRAVVACVNADLDASGTVAVNEVVAAVSASLQGCAGG